MEGGLQQLRWWLFLFAGAHTHPTEGCPPEKRTMRVMLGDFSREEPRGKKEMAAGCCVVLVAGEFAGTGLVLPVHSKLHNCRRKKDLLAAVVRRERSAKQGCQGLPENWIGNGWRGSEWLERRIGFLHVLNRDSEGKEKGSTAFYTKYMQINNIKNNS